MKALRSVLRALIYPVTYIAVQIGVSLIMAVIAGVGFILKNIDVYTLRDDLINATAQYIKDYSSANLQNQLLISAVITFVIIIIFMRRKRQNLFAVLALSPVRAADTVLLVICGIALNLTCQLLMSLLSLPQWLIEKYQSSSAVTLFSNFSLLNIICIIVIVPFIEEIVFRGFALNRLRSGMALVPAVLLQAIMFSILHLNLFQAIYVFLAGIVLGLSYLWSKSLFGSILLHSAYNCTSLVLAQIPESSDYQTLLAAVIFASPAVLFAGLIILYRSSKTNQSAPPPVG